MKPFCSSQRMLHISLSNSLTRASTTSFLQIFRVSLKILQKILKNQKFSNKNPRQICRQQLPTRESSIESSALDVGFEKSTNRGERIRSRNHCAWWSTYNPEVRISSYSTAVHAGVTVLLRLLRLERMHTFTRLRSKRLRACVRA